LNGERISEVILATNPTVEGGATALYLTSLIACKGNPDCLRDSHGWRDRICRYRRCQRPWKDGGNFKGQAGRLSKSLSGQNSSQPQVFFSIHIMLWQGGI
jgi:hypothetical protein